MNKIAVDDKIQSVIHAINACPEKMKASPPVEHFFSEGLYTRIMTVKAGTLLVGKVHRHKTLNLLMQGVMLTFMGHDHKPEKMTAPFAFESDAGRQKMLYAVTDCIFSNVHVTDLTDIEEIERQFIVPESEYLLEDSA